MEASVQILDYLPGDVDEDLAVTDWDAIQLNRYLAGWQLPVHGKAADLDADGTITDWDAILLERTLAGWKPEVK